MEEDDPPPNGGAEAGAAKEAFKGAKDGVEDGATKEAIGGAEVYIVEKKEQQKETKEEE